MTNTNFTALSHATGGIKGTLSRLTIAFALVAGTVFAATSAEARITRIEITSTQSPTFEGMTFGSVGAYEKLRGRAYGEVTPADARNALITYEYISFDNSTMLASNLAHTAANLDTSQATLSVRQYLTDPPSALPSSGVRRERRV